MKEHITEFLNEFMLGTISTVTPDSKPESAYVGFTHSSDLRIIIGTSKKTRKYQNLQHNPHVAFVVASTKGEVQYEGDAAEISEADYYALVEDGAFTHLPGIQKYRNDPNQVYLLIKPTWLRFIQHGEQDVVEEMTEF